VLRHGADRGIIDLGKGFYLRGKEITAMEMTDSQFKGFIRFVLDALAEMKAEHDTAKREEKLEKAMANLQKTLED
jgi:hypothetical protein